MIYRAKVLKNPTGKTIEFMCGHQTYIFKPGEEKMLEGFSAHHGLKEVNTGLIEVIPGEGIAVGYAAVDQEELKKEMKMGEWGEGAKLSRGKEIDDLTYDQLRKLAKVKGVLKFGMNREAILKVLREAMKLEELGKKNEQ